MFCWVSGDFHVFRGLTGFLRCSLSGVGKYLGADDLAPDLFVGRGFDFGFVALCFVDPCLLDFGLVALCFVDPCLLDFDFAALCFVDPGLFGFDFADSCFLDFVDLCFVDLAPVGFDSVFLYFSSINLAKVCDYTRHPDAWD